MRGRVVLIGLFLLLSPRTSMGQPSQMLTFHGPLHDREGKPVTGTVEVVFRIYDAPLGGTLVAGPFGPQRITPAAGLFSESFGPVHPERIDGGGVWLEITVGRTPGPRLEMEKVYYDGPDGHGGLVGGRTLMLRASRAAARSAAPAITILESGPSSNRLDLVFVGDGYTDSQLGTYAVHVENVLNHLLAVEPFASYNSFFNAHRVDVVSNEAGVDNDSLPGISRDTALDMRFWCGGDQQRLCVDVGKAFQYAKNAPELDHVFAIANSTLYGGAGYALSNLATAAGGNDLAAEIIDHETGHSLGNLADEYDNGEFTTYTGPEPVEPNISTLSSAAMAASGTKWARWLGDPGIGFGGVVGTYEGAYYNEFGVFRPTVDSKMRTLAAPFNLPSVESLVLEFYKFVHPIDNATPPGTLLDQQSVAFVDPVDPPGNPLEIRWYLDGNPVVGATQESLRVASYGFAPGAHVLSVTVRDNTPFVRNETERDTWLTESRSWGLYSSVNALWQNRPNPFNPETIIFYSVAARGKVTIRIYDMSGRCVKALADAVIDPGIHQVRWAGDLDLGGRAASGVYFYRIDYPNQTSSVKKMMMLR